MIDDSSNFATPVEAHAAGRHWDGMMGSDRWGNIKPRTTWLSAYLNGGCRCAAARSAHAARERERMRERRKCPKYREAVAEWNRLRRTGWSQDRFEAAMEIQQGRCAICGCEIDESANADHCHATGKPRALTCSTCNTLGIRRIDTLPDGLCVEDFIARSIDWHMNDPVLCLMWEPDWPSEQRRGKSGASKRQTDAIWQHFDGKCALTGEPLGRDKGAGHWAIDHWHKHEDGTGPIRGLLSNASNLFEGWIDKRSRAVAMYGPDGQPIDREIVAEAFIRRVAAYCRGDCDITAAIDEAVVVHEDGVVNNG